MQNNRIRKMIFLDVTDLEKQITQLLDDFSELRDPTRNVLLYDRNSNKNIENEVLNVEKIKVQSCNLFLTKYINEINKHDIPFEFIEQNPYYKAKSLFRYCLSNLMDKLKPLRLAKVLNELTEKIDEFKHVEVPKPSSYYHISVIKTYDKGYAEKFNQSEEKQHHFVTKTVLSEIRDQFKNDEKNINITKIGMLFLLAKKNKLSFFKDAPYPIMTKILDEVSDDTKIEKKIK